MDHEDKLKKIIREQKIRISDQDAELELLRAAIDLSEVGFTLSDANGIAVRVNDSQVRITGDDADYTVGKSLGEIGKEKNNESATMKVIDTLKPVVIEQMQPSGKSYLVYGRPYFDPNGKLKYVVNNLIDNTEHNKIRHKLDNELKNNIKLKKELKQLKNIAGIKRSLVYTSNKMHKLIDLCDKIAPFDSTVLIYGESGTGKELVADYIHQKSSRVNQPFLKINCSAIPESLIESELFGYDAGAFTNAKSGGKKGILEVADNGTVLLDEIGELPLKLQPKLLRFIQEGEFYHIGSTKPQTTNVRLIASTNRDLEEMIGEGSFRKDLYYRLSVIKLVIPPLKDRPEDIPLLVKYFLQIYNERYNLKRNFTFNAIKYLEEYDYEGNVRDLQNMVERLILLTSNDEIDIYDIDQIMQLEHQPVEMRDDYEADIVTEASEGNLKERVDEYEKRLLEKYYEKYGSASRIAKELNTSQPTVSRKLHGYGIIGDNKK